MRTPEHSRLEKPLKVFEEYFRRMKSNDELTPGPMRILENDKNDPTLNLNLVEKKLVIA